MEIVYNNSILQIVKIFKYEEHHTVDDNRAFLRDDAPHLAQARHGKAFEGLLKRYFGK